MISASWFQGTESEARNSAIPLSRAAARRTSSEVPLDLYTIATYPALLSSRTFAPRRFPERDKPMASATAPGNLAGRAVEW